ncbi:MAG: hypothetical protein IKN16_01310 [Selenomonadaceae bacterium]|nr:hypothetical protein [Selenomonadaceae bacterium]
MSELKNLEIQEVSLVDNGANPEAKILLTKRNDDDANTILKRLSDKLAAQIQKFEDAEFLQVAKRYEILGEKAEELAPQLKKIKNADPDAYNALIQKFDTALELHKKAGTFEELGKSGTQGGDDDVKKLAAQIQKAENLSERWALDKAYQTLEEKNHVHL